MLGLVEDFAKTVRSFNSLQDLGDTLAVISRELGFSYYALIHHVDLRRTSCGVIHIDNYPSEWSQEFILRRLYRHDPVLNASTRVSVGFAWSDLSHIIRLTEHHRHILAGARRLGLGEGFTVPAHVPGEINGSCSFATRLGQPLPKCSLMAAQLVGAYAFQAARRLTGGRDERAEWYRELTPRQRECLLWAARGKSDGEIAIILGIGEETVTKHVNAVRDRYDVARRQQAVMRALFDGQLSFIEALH